MVSLGYVLSSEEHSPPDLVRQAVAAEEAGFGSALISDHYMPWVEAQGESCDVWGVIGAISRATSRIRVGTGVTCPLFRNHPALIAQAAATAESLMPGRFFLGLGTGERLNEHVLGQTWPRVAVRMEMLEEAVEIMRRLWQGGMVSHKGRYYQVEEAQLFSLPGSPPPLYLAAAGPNAAERAGAIGDGLIATAPDAAVVEAFQRTGNKGRRLARMSVCYAESEAAAVETAREHWPNGALHGSFMLDLATPRDFEAVAGYLTDDKVAESIVCGPDPEKHLARIQAYADAGFDEVCVHQAGKDQDAFFRFYRREILPRFRQEAPAENATTGGKQWRG